MIHLIEQLEQAAEKAFGHIAALEARNKELSEKLSALELELLEKDEVLENARKGTEETEASLQKVQRLESEKTQVQDRLQSLLNRYRNQIKKEERTS